MKLKEAIRGQWGIENKVHWILDVVFREDDSRARKNNLAANMSALKRITLNILKQMSDDKSIRRRRKCAGWSGEYLLSALGIQLHPLD